MRPRDAIAAVLLSMPVVPVVGAAVGVMGLAAQVVPLVAMGALAVLLEQVPNTASMLDEGPVPRVAAVPFVVAVPGDLGMVLGAADVLVVRTGAAVAGRFEVSAAVMAGLVLVVARLAGGVDLAAFEVAAGAARSGVPVVGVAVRAVPVADLLEVPREVVVTVIARAYRHGLPRRSGFRRRGRGRGPAGGGSAAARDCDAEGHIEAVAHQRHLGAGKAGGHGRLGVGAVQDRGQGGAEVGLDDAEFDADAGGELLVVHRERVVELGEQSAAIVERVHGWVPPGS